MGGRFRKLPKRNRSLSSVVTNHSSAFILYSALEEGKLGCDWWLWKFLLLDHFINLPHGVFKVVRSQLLGGWERGGLFLFSKLFFFFFLRFYASSWLAVVMVITEGCSKLRLCLSLCNSNEDLSLMEFKNKNKF